MWESPHKETASHESETWHKGGAQESVEVTLAVTHYIGDLELEEAILCSQTGTLVE
jgi:molybdopterin synthase catalytic subunit